MGYDLMDVHDAKRKPRGKNRRRKQRGPCSCPQCLMAADLADKGFDINDLDDSLMDMNDEDFDDEDLDNEDCKNDFDDEDFDDYDAKRRSRSKRQRWKSQHVPCSLMAADLETDEEYDDEDDYDEFMAMDDGDNFDDEDGLDDEDYDDLMNVHDVKRRPRGRSQRRKQRGPCSCPQCLMAADLADKGFGIGNLSDTLMDMDDDDFDDEDLDAEDCKNDFDDEDFGDDNFDEYGVKRRSRNKRRQRRSQRVPCSLMTADLEDDQDYDDEDDLDEFMAMDGEDDFDDKDDLDDEDYDDEDDYDEFMAMDGEDDFDDEDYDNEDSYDEFMAMDDEDDFDDEDDLDDEDYDDEDFDWREPKWKARRNRAGNKTPFSNTQKNDIREALELAHCWARRVKGIFDQIWNQSGERRLRRDRRELWAKRKAEWRRIPEVSDWFGTGALSRQQIHQTRYRVRAIERILRKRRIRFVKIQYQSGRRSYECKRTETRSAYTFAGGIRKIFICPNFFNSDREGQARLIIHELVHEIGFCHYDLRGHPKCRSSGVKELSDLLELARRHPKAARKNPASYSQLYEALGGRC